MLSFVFIFLTSSPLVESNNCKLPEPWLPERCHKQDYIWLPPRKVAADDDEYGLFVMHVCIEGFRKIVLN